MGTDFLFGRHSVGSISTDKLHGHLSAIHSVATLLAQSKDKYMDTFQQVESKFKGWSGIECCRPYRRVVLKR
jgi:hypothetical protein